jgi:hypothetical protein
MRLLPDVHLECCARPYLWAMLLTESQQFKELRARRGLTQIEGRSRGGEIGP